MQLHFQILQQALQIIFKTLGNGYKQVNLLCQVLQL